MYYLLVGIIQNISISDFSVHQNRSAEICKIQLSNYTLFYLFFQISISQVTSSEHTHNYMKIQSMFRLYKMWLARFPQVNSWKFAYQIALIILWNTGATSNDCDTLISRISSIRDRYQAYFVHKLSQENSDRRLFQDDFAETALKELMQITAN